MRNVWNREDGVVAVIAAIIIICLFAAAALTIDIGQMYLTRSRLQAAADAASLAGARQLIVTGDTSEATDTCNTYIQKNLGEDAAPTVETDKANYKVTVSVSKEVQFYFAPLIGINSKTIGATATASASVVVKMKNVVPFGVVKQNFVYGEQYVMKYGAGTDDSGGGSYRGNFGALALGGTGAYNYLKNIKYGYQGEIGVGEATAVIDTEPGNMAGPTADGVSYRKSLCTNGCSFATQIEANCPRVVITPVIDSLSVNGRGEVTIVGFAAFFLEDTYEGDVVVGRFIKWAATGSGGAGDNYGLYTVRLIQ